MAAAGDHSHLAHGVGGAEVGDRVHLVRAVGRRTADLDHAALDNEEPVGWLTYLEELGPGRQGYHFTPCQYAMHQIFFHIEEDIAFHEKLQLALKHLLNFELRIHIVTHRHPLTLRSLQ